MKESNSLILFKVLYQDREIDLKTYLWEYRNLMMLLYDKIYVEGMGECKGMGRCGTCLIEIISAYPSLLIPERNEISTLKKMSISNTKMRLACQIIVDEKLDGMVIRILENEF